MDYIIKMGDSNEKRCKNGLSNSGTAGISYDAKIVNNGSNNIDVSSTFLRGDKPSLYNNLSTSFGAYAYVNLSGINFVKGMTICFWYYVEETPAKSILFQKAMPFDIYYMKLYTGLGSTENIIQFVGDNNTSIGYYPSNIPNIPGGATAPSTGLGTGSYAKWFHIAQTLQVYDHDIYGTRYVRGCFYYNSIPTAMNVKISTAGNLPFVGTKTSTGLCFFGSGDQYHCPKGYLNDYRIYNFAMTASQIKAVYNS